MKSGFFICLSAEHTHLSVNSENLKKLKYQLKKLFALLGNQGRILGAMSY